MRNSMMVLVLGAGFLASSASAEDSCSAAKAQIDDRLSQPGYTRSQRQQGEQLKQVLEMMCAAGGPQAAALITMQLDSVLPPPAETAIVRPVVSETELTSEYLRGQWCRGGQEATSYDFAPDGSFRYAVVGWNVTAAGHQYFPEIFPISEFLKQFGRVRSKDANRFVTAAGHGGRGAHTTFTRGACEFMTSRAAG